jgi:hypothetical protein
VGRHANEAPARMCGRQPLRAGEIFYFFGGGGGLDVADAYVAAVRTALKAFLDFWAGKRNGWGGALDGNAMTGHARCVGRYTRAV